MKTYMKTWVYNYDRMKQLNNVSGHKFMTATHTPPLSKCRPRHLVIKVTSQNKSKLITSIISNYLNNKT